jgi:hypothetical protein
VTYDPAMASIRRHLPTILLALSLPAGLAGYLVGVGVVGSVAPGNQLLALFVPLFIAGLCMMPFLVPWLDRRAKADLAAIRALGDEPARDAGVATPGAGEATPRAGEPTDRPSGDQG